MLGKTFYVLITNNDPLYLIGDIVPPPLFHIIERCCSIAKAQRYQTLADLKQSLVAAYDVLLNRAEGAGKAKPLLISITDKLTNLNKYNSAEVAEFIEQWALLNDDDLIRIGFEIPTGFFLAICQESFKNYMLSFLTSYEKIIESRDYSWSYAETIAANMRVIFNSDTVINSMKAKALDIAIRAAIYTNRFAAMDACKTMITSVNNESLGLDISGILLKFRDESFISRIEPSECKCVPIANALYQITPKKVNA
jgi:eukaryotic-like serine/threonine-protein kinase